MSAPVTRAVQNPLRIVFVGHVDHGKSTLVGRIFHDTGSLPDGKLDQIKLTCERRGVPFEWAFLMDALQAERDQNITIDTSQIWFNTETRPYVIIDAPGHREFLKNMITGAASADAAFLLIAANEGVREQSRRHGYMLSLLGIRQVVVLVNKMDAVGYDSHVFANIEREYREFLGEIGLDPIRFIPVSAREGDNVAQRPTTMPWYDGPTVLEALDNFALPRFDTELPLRFPIQDVYRFDDRRIIAGRVEAGKLAVGDELVFQPHDKVGVVASIQRWSDPSTGPAVAGESVGITLTEQIFVERGHVGGHRKDQPHVSNRFRANLFWMGRTPLQKGVNYKIKLATQEISVQVAELVRVIDASTLEEVDRGGELHRDDVAEVILETKTAVGIDLHNRVMAMGRFVIVDGYDLAGGGIVTDVLERTDTAVRADVRPVQPWERFRRNGHKGAVVWIAEHPQTGTFAAALERRLFNQGIHPVILDGTVVGTDHTAHVAVALALAGSVSITTMKGAAPQAEFDRMLGGTDAVVVRASLNGEAADVSVDIDRLGVVDAVDAFTEQLLPQLRQRWTVDASNI